jgi:hypothetical protein
VVADHHNPAKLAWPLGEASARTGRARSNGVSQHDISERRHRSPAAPTNSTSSPGAGTGHAIAGQAGIASPTEERNYRNSTQHYRTSRPVTRDDTRREQINQDKHRRRTR